MDLHYGAFHALKNINMEVPEQMVTAFIGPSGSGKSTSKVIESYERPIPECNITGEILLDGQNIYDPNRCKSPA